MTVLFSLPFPVGVPTLPFSMSLHRSVETLSLLQFPLPLAGRETLDPRISESLPPGQNKKKVCDGYFMEEDESFHFSVWPFLEEIPLSCLNRLLHIISLFFLTRGWLVKAVRKRVCVSSLLFSSKCYLLTVKYRPIK